MYKASGTIDRLISKFELAIKDQNILSAIREYECDGDEEIPLHYVTTQLWRTSARRAYGQPLQYQRTAETITRPKDETNGLFPWFLLLPLLIILKIYIST